MRGRGICREKLEAREVGGERNNDVRRKRLSRKRRKVVKQEQKKERQGKE
jgi:hypothetical protein